MILSTILLVAFSQAFITSACPDSIVVKNVNWDKVPSGHYLHGISLERVNGKQDFQFMNLKLTFCLLSCKLQENLQRQMILLVEGKLKKV